MFTARVIAALNQLERWTEHLTEREGACGLQVYLQ
jgi:hypothetical protein